MRHARIQQRKEPLDFVKAKIIHYLVLVQLKMTHPDTTEHEGPMTLYCSPEYWHIRVMFWPMTKEITFNNISLFLAP